MANLFYNNGKLMMLQGNLNLLTDTIKVMLMNSTYVPNASTQNVYSDITSVEVVGTGYVAGGKILLNKSLVKDNINDCAIFKADDLIWGTSTISARYAVIYDATESTLPLIACFDFGRLVESYGGDYHLNWNDYGIFKLS